MGSFLDSLRKCRTVPVAIRLRFVQEYDANTPSVYAFFESTDDRTFYEPSIRSHSPEGARLFTYLCDNKAGVYYQYDQAERSGKLKNVVCFVDKDIDDLGNLAWPIKRIRQTNAY
jgi:hypothetical protein